MSKPPNLPDNYADALDTIEAARITRATAQRLHRLSDGVRDPRIPEAERQVSDGLKIAHVHAELATADNLAVINRTLVVGLDGISQKLADLAELFTEALESNAGVDVDCTRCGGPIMLATAQAFDGMCEACKQHVDAEIDAEIVAMKGEFFVKAWEIAPGRVTATCSCGGWSPVAAPSLEVMLDAGEAHLATHKPVSGPHEGEDRA